MSEECKKNNCFNTNKGVLRQWVIGFKANLLMFTYGAQFGWMSPMSKLLQSDLSPTGRPLTDSDLADIASAMAFAAAITPLVFAWAVDKFGRKKPLIFIVVLQMIAWIIKLSSTHTISLIVGRICCGLATGGCFNVVPTYTKEISQDHVRGYLGSLFVLIQNFGIFFMYVIGSYVEYNLVLWISLLFPVVNLLLLVNVPESPDYLVKHGRKQEAVSVLAYLRNTKHDDKVIITEVELLESRNDDKKTTYLELFKNPIQRKAFIIVIALRVLQVSNGNQVILTYAASIMAASGVTFNPDLQTLSFPAVMILGSLVAMACVEKLGRRFLLIAGYTLSSLSLGALALTLYFQHEGVHTPFWIPLVTIMTSVFCYAGSISTVPGIVTAEMFRFQYRSKVTGIALTSCWFVSFVQTFVFQILVNIIGLHYMLVGFVCVNLLGCFVSLVLLPETKGKSIEEIERDLSK